MGKTKDLIEKVLAGAGLIGVSLLPGFLTGCKTVSYDQRSSSDIARDYAFAGEGTRALIPLARTPQQAAGLDATSNFMRDMAHIESRSGRNVSSNNQGLGGYNGGITPPSMQVPPVNSASTQSQITYPSFLCTGWADLNGDGTITKNELRNEGIRRVIPGQEIKSMLYTDGSTEGMSEVQFRVYDERGVEAFSAPVTFLNISKSRPVNRAIFGKNNLGGTFSLRWYVNGRVVGSNQIEVTGLAGSN